MADTDHGLLLELRHVEKDYRGLRPLRIQHLEIRQAQRVALLGFDHITAELFVNLVTGAVTPDAGDIRVFGQSTTAVTDADAWLASLDRFGILSERAVLLEQMTVAQNLAVPFSLHVDPIPPAVRMDVERLALEVGLETEDLARPVMDVGALQRARLRLGRAVALDPRVLLSEHPNAALAPGDLPAFAADLARVAAARRLASILLTADRTFAAAAADEVLTLQPATGALEGPAGWRRWLSRG